jgi:hypothetical protein
MVASQQHRRVEQQAEARNASGGIAEVFETVIRTINTQDQRMNTKYKGALSD